MVIILCYSWSEGTPGKCSFNVALWELSIILWQSQFAGSSSGKMLVRFLAASLLNYSFFTWRSPWWRLSGTALKQSSVRHSTKTFFRRLVYNSPNRRWQPFRSNEGNPWGIQTQDTLPKPHSYILTCPTEPGGASASCAWCPFHIASIDNSSSVVSIRRSSTEYSCNYWLCSSSQAPERPRLAPSLWVLIQVTWRGHNW